MREAEQRIEVAPSLKKKRSWSQGRWSSGQSSKLSWQRAEADGGGRGRRGATARLSWSASAAMAGPGARARDRPR
uniref:Uncharacterized protein n=1 Tax=Arundo donax TaxID=35708 RepID=A0A0A9E7Z1_ARUDO